MNPTIVPVAAMTPASAIPARALALSDDGTAELVILHDEETAQLIDAAQDALVLAVCRDDLAARHIDFRRARDLISYEVDRARGGVVHLTSIYLYLAQLAGNPRAQVVVTHLERQLSQLGIPAQAPRGVQESEARTRRTQTATSSRKITVRPRSRRAVGTRTASLMFAVFGL